MYILYIYICTWISYIHTHLGRLKRRATIKGSLNLRIFTMSWVVTRGVRWGRFPASSRICCLRLRAWTMIVLPRRFVSVWVVSHIWDESCHTCHIWMSHVTHITYEWVMSHVWMRHVAHMSESCHTYEMSHVTHMNESCHTYEMSHVTLIVYRSHIWMSHVTHMNESCHTYEWVMSHI